MTDTDGTCPNVPRQQLRSENVVTSGAETAYSLAIARGTGCQLWLAMTAGVEWSPVTTSAAGSSSWISPAKASASSSRWTFLSKSPSSPALSVFFTWT